MVPTNNDTRTLVEQALDAIMAKDVSRSLALFSDTAEMTDPHFPITTMRSKAEIERGLRWAFRVMKVMSFEIVHYFPSVDGQGVAVEVATAHQLSTGQALNFPQVFIFETQDGLISRLQAYEPYGPNGITGVFLGLNRAFTRWQWSKK